jgi:hypothetical protein
MSTTESALSRWREIIEDQQRSGLSVAAYCRRHGVAESSLFTWKRRLRAIASPATAFVELRPALRPASAGHDGGAIELHLREDRRLVLRPGFDPLTLREALAVLEQRSVAEDR